MTHQCDVCDKTFTRKTNLDRHRRTQHQSVLDIVMCILCAIPFKRPDNLKRHFISMHGMSEDTATINTKQAPKQQMPAQKFYDTKGEIYDPKLKMDVMFEQYSPEPTPVEDLEEILGLSMTPEQPVYIKVPQYSDISDTPINWDNHAEEFARSPPNKRQRSSSPEARPSTITEDISDEEDEEPTPTRPLLAITEGCPSFDSPLSPAMSIISSIGTPLQDEDRDEVISAATTTVTLRMFRHEEILRDGRVRVSRETAIEHTEDVCHWRREDFVHLAKDIMREVPEHFK